MKIFLMIVTGIFSLNSFGNQCIQAGDCKSGVCINGVCLENVSRKTATPTGLVPYSMSVTNCLDSGWLGFECAKIIIDEEWIVVKKGPDCNFVGRKAIKRMKKNNECQWRRISTYKE